MADDDYKAGIEEAEARATLNVVPFKPAPKPAGASVPDQLRTLAAAIEQGRMPSPASAVILLVPSDADGVVGLTTVGDDLRRMELIGVLNAMATIVTLSQPGEG